MTWRWAESNSAPHNVAQDKGLFRSGAPVPQDQPFTRIPSAGTFPYHCEVHRDPRNMVGTLKIKPRAGRIGAESFPVKWATRDSNTGNEYDVRFKVGSGDWRTWKNNTSSIRGRFGANDKPVNVRPDRTYGFQARSQKSSNRTKRSKWSPTLKVSP